MPPPPIRLDRVTIRRGGRDLARDLSGVLAPGSLTAIAGPNGAGKSTLLSVLGGLRPADHGRIDRGGLPAGAIALLPQEGRLDRAFPVSCREVVALGRGPHTGLFRGLGPDDFAAADRALDAVGLGGLGQRGIGALSVGQFQRVMFARTMVRDAQVILLDEPFAAVDAGTEADLMDIIRGWHQEGRTVAAVLHDQDLIRAEFPETILLGPPTPLWGATSAVMPPRRTRPRPAALSSALPGGPEMEAAA
jgi:zinc/manganese transport system ATP-binding protein